MVRSGGKSGRGHNAASSGGPSRGRGIAKSSHNSSCSALGAAIAAARAKHTPRVNAKCAVATGSLHLAALSETAQCEELATAEQIIELVRECIDGAESIALTTLGDRVRSLAMRRGLPGLHKQVKERWGGWETFVRTHASEEFSLAHGVVRARPGGGVAAAMDAQVESLRAVVSSRDVNALSMDAAAL